jgi:hypothetical protein
MFLQKEIRLILFVDDIIVHAEKANESTELLFD